MSVHFRSFVGAVEAALAHASDEAKLLAMVEATMAALVARDDWLPLDCAQPHPFHYQQYLLHRDGARRFSVVSFVWAPGQQTPIHDHTVWGVIGMLRGAELAQRYRVGPQGMEQDGPTQTLQSGEVATVSPAVGDIHRVANAFADRVSISIHDYGSDIGRTRRHVFDPRTGAATEFISGYANARCEVT